MIIDASRILDSLITEFDHIRQRLDDSDTEGSAAQSIANALVLLRNRERGNTAYLQRQFESLLDLLAGLQAMLQASDDPSTNALAELIRRGQKAQTLAQLSQLETAWRETLGAFQTYLIELNGSGRLGTETKAAISRRVAAWESADLLDQASRPTGNSEIEAGAVRINKENLTAYLAQHLNDPGVIVKSVSPLAGGYGKQTVLFDLESKALSGSLVMRRDMTMPTGVDNDCHQVEQEYAVIRAVFDTGYPAPDALWLDTEHSLLPGGHFLVMRRAPGTMVGTFFGAKTKIPAKFADDLAEAAAQLHGLPPLTGLGDLTESIRGDSWALNQGECTERYIRNWYDLYRAGEHFASPAIISLYGWLLDNIPRREGRPVLLHGDFGFNNFLFHNDTLSVVLDWEFAHIGDPAEELGYIKVTVGGALDWDRLMARYIASGGEPVDPQTLKFFEIWAYVRNASGASLLSNCFNTGLSNDLKLTILPHGHMPQFIRGAQALIDQY